MQIQTFGAWGVFLLCSAVCAAAGGVVALVEQRHEQPCKIGELGRAHLPNLASQWKMETEK